MYFWVQIFFINIVYLIKTKLVFQISFRKIIYNLKKWRNSIRKWRNLSIFIDWTSISNRRQVFHTVGSNLSCFGKIGWAPPVSRIWPAAGAFSNLNIELNNSPLDRNLRQWLFIPILQVGTVKSKDCSHCQVLSIVFKEKFLWNICNLLFNCDNSWRILMFSQKCMKWIKKNPNMRGS
jgi:hypothetical protein